MVYKDKRAIAFLVTVLSVFLVTGYLENPAEKNPGDIYSLPLTIGQWEGNDVEYDPELLASWLGTTKIVFRNYRNRVNGYDVTLYVAYYKDFESSDKAHAPEVCYPGQGWEVRSDGDVQYELSGSNAHFRRMTVEKNSEQEIVYSWWQTGKKIIPYNSWYHLNQILNKITFQDTSAIWVRISAGISGDQGKNTHGEDMIKVFCKDAAPLFTNYFQHKV
jgi:EpsI family protein